MNYFPTSYTPYNIYPTQQTQQYAPQTQQYTQPQYSPPTIRAEIIQVSDEAEVQNYPLAAGATQMFMSKDDKYIFIKTAYTNSPAQVITYSKGEQKPPVEYVTKEELDKRLSDMMNRIKNPPKKEVKE